MTNFLSVYDKPVIIRNPANCRESKVLVEQNRINILSANVKVDFLKKIMKYEGKSLKLAMKKFISVFRTKLIGIVVFEILFNSNKNISAAYKHRIALLKKTIYEID